MKRNLLTLLGVCTIATLAVIAFTIAPNLTGHGGMGGYSAPAPAVFDLTSEANAQSVGGPTNFPYGIYNGCSGSIQASAGIATGTAVAPCNPAQLHGCMANAQDNATPVAGDVAKCVVTGMPIVTVVGTASATVTVTGVKVIYATANGNKTAVWQGY